MLDVPQPLLRLHRLDQEVAVALAAAFLVGVADPDHALPLPAHGEHGMDRGEDPEPRLLEVVLQALEDERSVGGVGLDHRRFQREAAAPAHGRRLRLRRVAGRDVDAGKALEELMRGRHLPGDEPEMGEEPRGERVRGQAQGQAIRHLGEDDGGQGEDELAVLGRRLALQDVDDLRKPRRPELGIRGEHGSFPPVPDPAMLHERARPSRANGSARMTASIP